MATKLGRQGYYLVYTKLDVATDKPWVWSVETHNGHVIADSSTSFRARWDAKRQAKRLFAGVVAGEKTEIV